MPFWDRQVLPTKVLTGWTGNVAVTQGGVTVTVDPTTFNSGSNSVASVLQRLARNCKSRFGEQWECWLESGGLVKIRTYKEGGSAATTFTVTATNNTQTRLGLAASTAATSFGDDGQMVTGTDKVANENALYDWSDIQFKTHDRETKNAKSLHLTGTGTIRGAPSRWVSTQGNMIVLFTTWSKAWDAMDTILSTGSGGYKFDLQFGPRMLGRWLVTKGVIKKPGKSTSIWTLNATVRSQSLEH